MFLVLIHHLQGVLQFIIIIIIIIIHLSWVNVFLTVHHELTIQ